MSTSALDAINRPNCTQTPKVLFSGDRNKIWSISRYLPPCLNWLPLRNEIAKMRCLKTKRFCAKESLGQIQKPKSYFPVRFNSPRIEESRQPRITSSNCPQSLKCTLAGTRSNNFHPVLLCPSSSSKVKNHSKLTACLTARTDCCYPDKQ